MERVQLGRLYPLCFWPLMLLVSVASADLRRPDRAMFSNFHSAHYPEELKRPNVRALIESRDAPMIWIGSDAGLVSWDGNRVKNRLRRPVTALGIDGFNYNWLWVGTEGDGLYRMYNNDEEPIAYPPGEEDDTLIDGHVRCIVEGTLSINTSGDSQRKEVGLWVATNHGLHSVSAKSGTQGQDFLIKRIEQTSARKIRGGRGTLHADSGTILTLLPGEDSLWMGTKGGKLRRRDLRTGTTVTEFEFEFPITSLSWLTQSPPKSKSAENEQIELTVKTERPILLVGTDGGGIHRIDLTTRSNSVFGKGLENGEVTSIAVDSSHRVWAGTRYGLARLNDGENRFQLYHDEKGETALTGDEVECIYLTSGKQLLWVGTTFGVSMLDTSHRWFTHIAPVSTKDSSLLGRTVRGFATADDNDSILVCSDRALETVDLTTNSVTGRLYEDGIDSLQINSALRDSNGNLWMGTDRGLNLQTAGEDSILPIYRDKLDDAVTCILEDSRQRLWFGTYNSGVAVRSVNSNEVSASLGFALQFSSSSTPSVSFLQEDLEGNIWVGTAGDGLYIINGETGSTTHHGREVTSTASFNASYINTIHRDKKGNLWIATADNGLFRYDSGNRHFAHFTELSTPTQGSFHPESVSLPNNICAAILDDEDNLWVATSTELIVQFSDSLETRIFTSSDGLQDSFVEGAAFKSGSGELFFGGKTGVNIVAPGKLPIRAHAKIAVLTGLEIFGELVEHGPGQVIERPLNLVDRLVLNHEETQVGFTFSTPGFDSFGRTSYRYRMINHDQDWQMAQKGRRDAQYSLAPGHYEFEVQAAPDGRSWQGASPLSVIVKPPWHKTMTAKIAGALILTLLLVGAMRAHSNQLNRRKERLNAERDKAEATLARQLQKSMLVDGDTLLASRHPDTQKIFQASLQQLGEFLKANRCRLWKLEYESDGQISGARACASYFADESDTEDTITFLPADHRHLKWMLAADEPLSLNNVDGKILGSTEDASSLLATRTNYLDKPNGVISVERFHDSASQTTKEKSKKWLSDELELISTVAGQIGLALAQLDLSEKEETHRLELVEAKRSAEIANSAKSEFLAKMTHELRTPLNAILGFCQVLCSDTSTSESQRDTLNIINRSGEHLLDIINDVLEMSKIEAGKTDLRRDRFELKRLIDSVQEMLHFKANEKGIDLRVKIDGSIPQEAFGDRSKIRQILVNLMGNSVKFTENGFIELRLHAEPKNDDTTILHFALEDSGRGIEAHELPSLFEKFAQTETGRTSHQGTGLGLAITRHFIELMGGTIKVSSEYGQGTLFEFSIECEPAVVDAEESNMQTEVLDKTVAAIAPGQKIPTILIVEDQPVNRILLRRVLTGVGFNVREAENGKIASDRWREWSPDLIFMDQDMPIMNGNEATRSIIAQAGSPDKAPPIVALTAYALEDTRRAAIKAGCRDFLTKPFKHTELFALVSRLLKVQYVFQEEGSDGTLPIPGKIKKNSPLAFPD